MIWDSSAAVLSITPIIVGSLKIVFSKGTTKKYILKIGISCNYFVTAVYLRWFGWLENNVACRFLSAISRSSLFCFCSKQKRLTQIGPWFQITIISLNRDRAHPIRTIIHFEGTPINRFKYFFFPTNVLLDFTEENFKLTNLDVNVWTLYQYIYWIYKLSIHSLNNCN